MVYRKRTWEQRGRKASPWFLMIWITNTNICCLQENKAQRQFVISTSVGKCHKDHHTCFSLPRLEVLSSGQETPGDWSLFQITCVADTMGLPHLPYFSGLPSWWAPAAHLENMAPSRPLHRWLSGTLSRDRPNITYEGGMVRGGTGSV